MELKLTYDLDLGKYFGHDDEIRVINFSSDNHWMFSGSWDRRIHIWKIPNWEKTDSIITSPKLILEDHNSSITSLSISQDQKYLISCSKDGTVKVWDPLTGNLYFTLTGHNQKIYSVTIDQSDTYLLTGGEESNICIWKIDKLVNGNMSYWDKIKCEKLISIPAAPVHVIRINPVAPLFASIGNENNIYVFNFPSGEIYRTFAGHQKWVYSLDFHPNQPFIISGGKEKRILLWNYDTGEIIRSILIKASVSQIKFNPNGENFMTVDLKNNINLYETSTGELMHSHHINKGKTLTVGVSSDWSLLAIAPFQVNPPKISLFSFFQN